jgi:hypothetical protein
MSLLGDRFRARANAGNPACSIATLHEGALHGNDRCRSGSVEYLKAIFCIL